MVRTIIASFSAALALCILSWISPAVSAAGKQFGKMGLPVAAMQMCADPDTKKGILATIAEAQVKVLESDGIKYLQPPVLVPVSFKLDCKQDHEHVSWCNYDDGVNGEVSLMSDKEGQRGQIIFKSAGKPDVLLRVSCQSKHGMTLRIQSPDWPIYTMAKEIPQAPALCTVATGAKKSVTWPVFVWETSNFLKVRVINDELDGPLQLSIKFGLNCAAGSTAITSCSFGDPASGGVEVKANEAAKIFETTPAGMKKKLKLELKCESPKGATVSVAK